LNTCCLNGIPIGGIAADKSPGNIFQQRRVVGCVFFVPLLACCSYTLFSHIRMNYRRHPLFVGNVHA